MADTKRYLSSPPLVLADDLSSSGSLIITTTALGWNDETLTSAMFNTDYIPATLINDAKTIVEFITLDPSTIANITTTGVTILKRGLKYFAEGDATDLDEVVANKLPWTQGQTKLLLGTNPPLLYGEFPARGNDEDITGDWTFTNFSPNIPDVIASDLTRAVNVQTWFDLLDGLGTDGDILTWDSGAYNFISPAAAGTILTSNGVGTVATFQASSVSIPVSDEGIQITPTVSSFDFVGTGVTATAIGNAVTVTIPGTGAIAFTDLTDVPPSYVGFGLDLVRVNAAETGLEFTTPSGVPIPVDDEGIQITAGVASFDFVGAGVTATAVGNNVTVTIPAGTTIPVDDEGVQITAGVTSFDFVGAGVTATAVGNDVTVTIPGSGGATDWNYSKISMTGVTAVGSAIVSLDLCFSSDQSKLYVLVTESSGNTAKIYLYDQDTLTGFYYRTTTSSSLNTVGGTPFGGIVFYNNQVYLMVQVNSVQTMKRYDDDLTNETAITISGGDNDETCSLANDGATFYSLADNLVNGGVYTLAGTTLTRNSSLSTITGAYATNSQRVKTLASSDSKLIFGWNTVAGVDAAGGMVNITFSNTAQTGGAATTMTVANNTGAQASSSGENIYAIKPYGDGDTATEYVIFMGDSSSVSDNVTRFNIIKISKSALGL